MEQITKHGMILKETGLILMPIRKKFSNFVHLMVQWELALGPAPFM